MHETKRAVSQGAALLVVPEQFFHAVMRQAPSGLEMLFARMVGVAMVYKAALAHILKGAAEADRLGATTAQRIMLGFLLRGISNLMAFRQIASCWAAFQYPVVLFLFPSLLLFSFGVNLLAFEPYNPFFLAKLLFPVGVGLLLGLLIPQPAAAGPAGFHADAPTWLKTGVLAGALPSKMASRAAGVAKVGVKAANKIAPRWMRTQIINKSYAIAMPKEAGPGLAKTITRKVSGLTLGCTAGL
ncbi:hypothetical protein MNEG_3928 [Monoraphidium neglectum]|uniref:Uncharacterized protein n=1 Tax=Monoraphidium neglectum TaxID=145388 RepID=A0A0D2LBB7_9CHLO|nr:hypothetical protein MNEG_3928 [Monoraphidium neglectum]KIZ04029.1 hypothetical protein MNEG_3928 [Monoraphidium neglectum]|eukprot:XP_013903048.1 hypothetical protein MNEG_3928 [Monoraphidium neglectum]